MNRNELGEDVIFFEPAAAARSLKSWWTRLASTYDCMQVILSREHLIIRPRKLPAVLIRALRLDLDHAIPTLRISTVERTGSFLSYGKILVSFSTGDGAHPGVELYLRNAGDLLRHLADRTEQDPGTL